ELFRELFHTFREGVVSTCWSCHTSRRAHRLQIRQVTRTGSRQERFMRQTSGRQKTRTRRAALAGERETAVCGQLRRSAAAVATPMTCMAAFASASCSNADRPREGIAAAKQALGTDFAAYWRLDELSGTIAADSSGRGYTGQLAGGPAWTTGHPGTDGGLSF